MDTDDYDILFDYDFFPEETSENPFSHFGPNSHPNPLKDFFNTAANKHGVYDHAEPYEPDDI